MLCFRTGVVVAGASAVLIGLCADDALRTVQASEGMAAQAARGRVIWQGVRTATLMGPDCQRQVEESFIWIGEEDTNGETRWLSRKIRWSDVHTCTDEIIFHEDDDNDPTTPPRRVLRPYSGRCENHGEVDLATWNGETVRGRCHETPRGGFMSPSSLPTRFAGPRPEDQMRNGCAYNWREVQPPGPSGHVGIATESVVRLAELHAVVEVDRDIYRSFVPEPGKTLTFTARSVSGPVRFRFELSRAGTSRFPGYATNANVDEVFLLKHDLAHLRGTYADDGPDFIFDPARFSTTQWSRTDHELVETRTAESGIVVPVTAMDYGAVGLVRAYAQREDCGGAWQPVPVQVGGETHESLTLPLDADDNLIADALEQYRGLQSGVDADAEPKGNGIVGDGLTAFEEYRGFKIRGTGCVGDVGSAATLEPAMPPPEPFPDESPRSLMPGWDDEHIRTAPHHKNLFVHTPDPEFVVMLDNFAWASGLSVHALCGYHYIDNDSRIVNFTLQQAGLRTWRGRTVSQRQAQHGLLLLPVSETLYASVGTAIPVVDGTSGPPKFIHYIEIEKSLPVPGERGLDRRAREDSNRERSLDWVVTHELGHAVGLTHHGDDVRQWRDIHGPMNVTPLTSPYQRAGGPIDFSRNYADHDYPSMLLVDRLMNPGCDQNDDSAAYDMNGQFVGCLADHIARRGQQNSGDLDCPMRYVGADWYEPPGSTAVYLYPGFVTLRATPGNSEPLIRVDAWSGRLRRYANDLDREPRGKMCVRIDGTGINRLPGPLNHAGDVGRGRPCADLIVVNDVAAPDPPR